MERVLKNKKQRTEKRLSTLSLTRLLSVYLTLNTTLTLIRGSVRCRVTSSLIEPVSRIRFDFLIRQCCHPTVTARLEQCTGTRVRFDYLLESKGKGERGERGTRDIYRGHRSRAHHSHVTPEL